MTALWRRVPVMVRAVLTGIAVAAAGVIPWAGTAGAVGLAGWNARLLPTIPWAMLPYYFAFSTVYGALAYATNSILPGLVLHAGGDVFALTRLWSTGEPVWQLSSTAPALIRETGPDFAFARSVITFMLFAGAAARACGELARTARSAPTHAS
jgi:hypothetical protein